MVLLRSPQVPCPAQMLGAMPPPVRELSQSHRAVIPKSAATRDLSSIVPCRQRAKQREIPRFARNDGANEPSRLRLRHGRHAKRCALKIFTLDEKSLHQRYLRNFWTSCTNFLVILELGMNFPSSDPQ